MELAKNELKNLYFLAAILLIANFLLTSNPYAALHSGAIGVAGVDSSYFVSPAYLILSSMIFVTLLYQKNIVLDYKIILVIGSMFLSGIATNTLFSNGVTYIYNALAFIFCSSLAISMSYNKSSLTLKDAKKVFKFLNLIFLVGIILALAFPYKYGVLPFEFSRFSRGEITLWSFTFLTTIYSCFVVASYDKFKIKLPIVVSVAMLIVVLSTASRAPLLSMILPFVIYIFVLSKPIVKLFGIMAAILIAILFSEDILAFFLNTPSGDVSNGRLELWQYHWNAFVQNPLFGSGAFFQTNLGEYTGIADSEIGILKMYSEFGFIFGMIMTFFVLKGFCIAVVTFVNLKKANFTDIFFSLMLVSLSPNIVQSYSRILNIEDMMFWLSVFYLAAKSKPLVPYISLLNTNKRIGTNRTT